MPPIISMAVPGWVVRQAMTYAEDTHFATSVSADVTDNQSTVRGFVGKLMAGVLLKKTYPRVEYVDTHDYDYTIVHKKEAHLPLKERTRDITVVVKSLVVTGNVSEEREKMVTFDDEAQVHTNFRQNCHYYLFVRVHEDLTRVWFCGSIHKKRFMAISRLHKAGDAREKLVDTTYYTDTRVVRLYELNEPELGLHYRRYIKNYTV